MARRSTSKKNKDSTVERIGKLLSLPKNNLLAELKEGLKMGSSEKKELAKHIDVLEAWTGRIARELEGEDYEAVNELVVAGADVLAIFEKVAVLDTNVIESFAKWINDMDCGSKEERYVHAMANIISVFTDLLEAAEVASVAFPNVHKHLARLLSSKGNTYPHVLLKRNVAEAVLISLSKSTQNKQYLDPNGLVAVFLSTSDSTLKETLIHIIRRGVINYKPAAKEVEANRSRALKTLCAQVGDELFQRIKQSGKQHGAMDVALACPTLPAFAVQPEPVEMPRPSARKPLPASTPPSAGRKRNLFADIDDLSPSPMPKLSGAKRTKRADPLSQSLKIRISSEPERNAIGGKWEAPESLLLGRSWMDDASSDEEENADQEIEQMQRALTETLNRKEERTLNEMSEIMEEVQELVDITKKEKIVDKREELATKLEALRQEAKMDHENVLGTLQKEKGTIKNVETLHKKFVEDSRVMKKRLGDVLADLDDIMPNSSDLNAQVDGNIRVMVTRGKEILEKKMKKKQNKTDAVMKMFSMMTQEFASSSRALR